MASCPGRPDWSNKTPVESSAGSVVLSRWLHAEMQRRVGLFGAVRWRERTGRRVLA